MILNYQDRIYQTMCFIGYKNSKPCYSLLEIKDNQKVRSERIVQFDGDEFLIIDLD